jgi:hypothetical protein
MKNKLPNITITNNEKQLLECKFYEICRSGKLDEVQEILKHDCIDIFSCDARGLEWSFNKKQFAIFEYLIDFSINKKIIHNFKQEHINNCILAASMKKSDIDCVKFLFQSHKLPTKPDITSINFASISNAVIFKNLNFLSFLLEENILDLHNEKFKKYLNKNKNINSKFLHFYLQTKLQNSSLVKNKSIKI